MLTDAGPLVALLDEGETDHARCREALEQLRGPLLTTWDPVPGYGVLCGPSFGSAHSVPRSELL
jgi:hypothetical protein